MEVPWEGKRGARLVGLVQEATEDCCSQVNNASWAHAQSVSVYRLPVGRSSGTWTSRWSSCLYLYSGYLSPEEWIISSHGNR